MKQNIWSIWERIHSAMRDIQLSNFKLFVNQRLQPKHDLLVKASEVAGTGQYYNAQLIPDDNTDMHSMYNLYLKRCGALLQNPQGDLDETSGVLSYEDFAHFYPHVTVDVAQVEQPQINKQLSVTLDFAVKHL